MAGQALHSDSMALQNLLVEHTVQRQLAPSQSRLERVTHVCLPDHTTAALEWYATRWLVPAYGVSSLQAGCTAQKQSAQWPSGMGCPSCWMPARALGRCPWTLPRQAATGSPAPPVNTCGVPEGSASSLHQSTHLPFPASLRCRHACRVHVDAERAQRQRLNLMSHHLQHLFACWLARQSCVDSPYPNI